VTGERRVVLAELRDGPLDGLRNGLPGALVIVRTRTRVAAQIDNGADVLLDPGGFLSKFHGAFGVPGGDRGGDPLLEFIESGSEAANSEPVGCTASRRRRAAANWVAGFILSDKTSVKFRGIKGSAEGRLRDLHVDHVHSLTWMGEQQGEVAWTHPVTERCLLVVEPDMPVAPVLAEGRDLFVGVVGPVTLRHGQDQHTGVGQGPRLELLGVPSMSLHEGGANLVPVSLVQVMDPRRAASSEGTPT